MTVGEVNAHPVIADLAQTGDLDAWQDRHRFMVEDLTAGACITCFEAESSVRSPLSHVTVKCCASALAVNPAIMCRISLS
ncbi:hypothetical protein [Actibacterium sp. 188UL27-1]|uniref:hypothetical protein n=1 Tax=Actibacterium sp. 188UL27-1 TaxID=2786961 RepID=UPI001EF51391|nr:hypothetical protein [Actibacterium sp. 188UL27-1]